MGELILNQRWPRPSTWDGCLRLGGGEGVGFAGGEWGEGGLLNNRRLRPRRRIEELWPGPLARRSSLVAVLPRVTLCTGTGIHSAPERWLRGPLFDLRLTIV